MRTNLFLSLYKSSGGRQLENFSTAALAWLVENEMPTRCALLRACRAGVTITSANSEAILSALEQAPNVPAYTQRRIPVLEEIDGRACRPDLQLGDSSGAFLLFEVKTFSRPSFHLAGLDDPAPPRVIQTETYRRWLDRVHPTSGLLFALTTGTERDLCRHCHGNFTWTQLERSFRNVESLSHLAREFCDFLMEKQMATASADALTVADAEQIQVGAAVRWDKWENLLDEAVQELHRQLKATKRMSDLRIVERSMNLSRDARDRDWTFGAWKSWIDGKFGKKRFWLTPHIEVASTNRLEFGFEIGFMGWDEHRFREALPTIREIERSDFGVYCTLDVPDSLFSQSTIQEQASAIANAAVERIVLALIREADNARKPR